MSAFSETWTTNLLSNLELSLLPAIKHATCEVTNPLLDNIGRHKPRSQDRYSRRSFSIISLHLTDSSCPEYADLVFMEFVGLCTADMIHLFLSVGTWSYNKSCQLSQCQSVFATWSRAAPWNQLNKIFILIQLTSKSNDKHMWIECGTESITGYGYHKSVGCSGVQVSLMTRCDFCFFCSTGT